MTTYPQTNPQMDQLQRVSRKDLGDEALRKALTILVRQEGVWTEEALECWKIGRAEMEKDLRKQMREEIEKNK